jgi:hypothetical protein
MIRKNLENKKTKGNHKEKDTKRAIKRRGGKHKPHRRNRNLKKTFEIVNN